jgi:hypothetical protein
MRVMDLARLANAEDFGNVRDKTAVFRCHGKVSKTVNSGPTRSEAPPCSFVY